MVEGGTAPRAGAMTGPAVRPKAAIMVIVLFMAGIAILRCALENAIYMATGTCHINMSTGQFKCRQIMIEGGILPIACIMAGSAIRAKAAIVMVVLFMAGIAILRCALEDTIYMALRAGDIDMPACQLESREVVVECDVLPAVCIMTSAAVRAKTSVVLIVLFMAGIAILRRTLEDVVHVTLGTGHIQVPACQLESCKIVVKFCRLPAIGRMTGSAIRAELTVVRVILFMAGIAILRSTFEDAIHMAFLAGHAQMFSNQRECKFGMIDTDLVPTFGCMAGGAIGAKLAAMFVILLVTRETIRWRPFKHPIDVAFFALNINMQTGELKSGQVMVEVGWFPALRRVA